MLAYSDKPVRGVRSGAESKGERIKGSMDYAKAARQIYEKVGKRKNLVSAAHCATRLRLVPADNAKCDRHKGRGGN